jgi:ribosomal protein S18 acetylase RimI-like enzyme
MTKLCKEEKMLTTQKPLVRWTIRRDLPEILKIESLTSNPWKENDFLSFLRKDASIGLVADCNEKIIGHLMYSLYKDHYRISRIAVLEKHKGIGTRLVGKLIAKLTPMSKRTRIVIEVPETNMEMLYFFRYMKFLATEVIRGIDDEDMIEMEYNYDE